MILTTEVITREALKILNKSFYDTYAKQHRKLLGGNNYIHGFCGVDAEDGEHSNPENAAGFTLRYKGTGR